MVSALIWTTMATIAALAVAIEQFRTVNGPFGFVVHGAVRVQPVWQPGPLLWAVAVGAAGRGADHGTARVPADVPDHRLLGDPAAIPMGFDPTTSVSAERAAEMAASWTSSWEPARSRLGGSEPAEELIHVLMVEIKHDAPRSVFPAQDEGRQQEDG